MSRLIIWRDQRPILHVRPPERESSLVADPCFLMMASSAQPSRLSAEGLASAVPLCFTTSNRRIFYIALS